MHETSLAKQLLEVALTRAHEHGANRVLVVKGWIAETERLDASALELHFRAHARGTAAERARLDLELRHVEARCSGCGASYLPEHHLLLCPECGSTEATLSGETGVGIDTLEVD